MTSMRKRTFAIANDRFLLVFALFHRRIGFTVILVNTYSQLHCSTNNFLMVFIILVSFIS